MPEETEPQGKFMADGSLLGYPDDEGCITRYKDGIIAEMRLPENKDYDKWAELFRDDIFVTEGFCPKSPHFRHDGDPATITPADGVEWTVDVSCKYCGRSGSVAIDPADVDF
jgi:hypothetical protein